MDEQYLVMKSILHHNVPKFINHIKQRGGVQDSEWEWLRSDTGETLDYIIERADETLLYPKNKETFDKAIFILVKALAIMSFISGGVRICGLHFSPDISEFVENELS